MPIETINKYPHWQWSDRQFKIKDQWMRACYKSRDCHSLRPIYPEFSDSDNSFTLSLRRMFSDEIVSTKIFKDYRKVLVRDMLEFYDDSHIDYMNK